MTKLRDKIWLWGQTPGSHHASAGYNLPGTNRMTPIEGCEFFNISKCCRVAMRLGPTPPFDDESEALKGLKQVVWSAIGAGGVHRNEEQYGDLEEVIRQAKIYPNIVGAIMDDFLLSESRRNNFVPEKLELMKSILRQEAGRPLEFWTVYYERELHLSVQEYLDVFDVITFWTWRGENLLALRKNLDSVLEANPGKRLLAGCYMWDYGDGKPLTPELMRLQLDTYREYMHAGKLDGFIICSNCIADVGIEEVEQTRAWLNKHGDEEV